MWEESTQGHHLITGRDRTATCTLWPGPQLWALTHLAFTEDSRGKAPVLGNWEAGGLQFQFPESYNLLSMHTKMLISVNDHGHLMRRLLKPSRLLFANYIQHKLNK